MPGLHFEVDWADASSALTAADLTRGKVRLSAPGLVWPGPDAAGVSWTWIELLEWLAVAWPSLLHEEGMPLGLRPARPSVIEGHAEHQWESLPHDRLQTEELAFEAFEDSHNLARGLQGILLPPLWVIRYGRTGFVCTERGVSEQRYSGILETLEAFGETIARRLRSNLVDARATAALAYWDDREAMSNDLGVSLATGLDPATLDEIAGNRALSEVFELSSESFQPNELLAAARQASQFTSSSISAVIQYVATAERCQTSALDELSTEAVDVLAQQPVLKLFEQGYLIAEWLREALGVPPLGQANPLRTLKEWAVEVREIDLPTQGIDAFGCWGPQHGPTVFVNVRGFHNATTGGYRATLAHEICHLVLDREGALPLAEVLGGREAPGVESRARAFAVEFLMPRKHAGAIMSRSDEPLKSLRSLQQRFGVSMEVVAWQARNSGAILSEGVVEVLRSKVSRPDNF